MRINYVVLFFVLFFVNLFCMIFEVPWVAAGLSFLIVSYCIYQIILSYRLRNKSEFYQRLKSIKVEKEKKQEEDKKANRERNKALLDDAVRKLIQNIELDLENYVTNNYTNYEANLNVIPTPMSFDRFNKKYVIDAVIKYFKQQGFDVSIVTYSSVGKFIRINLKEFSR